MAPHTTSGERALPPLEREELLRYSRHLLLDQVGVEGQRRLKAARVLLVGAGGLGSPAALYLAAAGVGTLGIVDFDVVDASNLQRQILHGTSDVGRAKTASARDTLEEINPNVRVETLDTQLGADNALEILRAFDLVIDGSDSFATRFLTSDASVLLGKPNVYGSIFRFEGQASVFNVDGGPCYRCLFREPPPPGLVPNCAEAGVLGVLPGLLGTIQATEAIKLILGVGEPLIGRLLQVDALEMSFRTVTVRRDPSCPSCGDAAHGGGTIRSLADRAADYQAPACDVPSEVVAGGIREITPADLKSRIERGDDFELIDVREPHEWEIAHLDGARLVPLGTIPHALADLDRSRDVVLYCKGGVRSLRAAEALRLAGFTRLSSVAGGIIRWSQEVDPSVPRY
jgi:adenylyltransferase/sulfurtransferase